MRPRRYHRHSFLIILQLLLTVSFLHLAPVSGLMDGGDFVTVKESNTPEPAPNGLHGGTCPNPNVNIEERFLEILSSQQLCPNDEVTSQEDPVEVKSETLYQQNIEKPFVIVSDKYKFKLYLSIQRIPSTNFMKPKKPLVHLSLSKQFQSALIYPMMNGKQRLRRQLTPQRSLTSLSLLRHPRRSPTLVERRVLSRRRP